MNPLTYVLIGVVAIFGLGALGLAIALYLDSRKKKQASAPKKISKKPNPEEAPEQVITSPDGTVVNKTIPTNSKPTPPVSLFTFADADNEKKLSFGQSTGEDSDSDIQLDR